VIFFGSAEAYRTGVLDPVFDELSVGDAYPGGRFDPIGLAAARLQHVHRQVGRRRCQG